MKKIFVSAIFGLTLAGSAFAQSSSATTSTSTLGSFYKKLKESPLGLSFYQDTATKRDSSDGNAIRGVDTVNMFTVSYKLSPNDSMKVYSRWDISKLQGQEISENTWNRAHISYSRSNILTEAKHGVGLSLGAGLRYHPDAQNRAAGSTYGLYRLEGNLSKSFGKFSLSNVFYVAKYIERDPKPNTMNNNYLDIITTQSYSLTDKWSVYTTQDWYRINKKGQGKLSSAGDIVRPIEAMDFYVGSAYQVTPEFGTELYSSVGGMVESHDGRTFKKNLQSNFNLGLIMTLTAF